jgi:hypothetical protein
MTAPISAPSATPRKNDMQEQMLPLEQLPTPIVTLPFVTSALVGCHRLIMSCPNCSSQFCVESCSSRFLRRINQDFVANLELQSQDKTEILE